MQYGNIERINYFRHEAPNDARIIRMDEFRQRYGFEPDGVNFYMGISRYAKSILDSEGNTGLNSTHQAFFQQVLEDLQNSDADSKMVVLALEPQEAADPFGYVDANLDWIGNIAEELLTYQNQAARIGKRLDIAVRYASEMNDRGNQTYGRRPDEYRASFAGVRTAFRGVTLGIPFSFSPALRADSDESELAQYWPGDQQVDFLGGTWYVGAPSDFAKSVQTLRQYVLHRVDKGLAFALSEIGGIGSRGNDGMLQMMFNELLALSTPDNVTFQYVTVFLDSKWGADATLNFLSQPPLQFAPAPNAAPAASDAVNH